MQGQDNERGDESANLDFKSSDIKKTNEGELFVNIKGDDERAAAEAEAKAKEEAELKSREKEQKRKAEEALKEERKASKKAAAEKNKEANRKKHKIASIVLGAIAIVILAAVGVITFIAISNRVQSQPGSEETEDQIIEKKIMERNAIYEEYENNPDFSVEDALAKYDEGIDSTEGLERNEWIIAKVKFVLIAVHDVDGAWSAWRDECGGDEEKDEQFAYICGALKGDIERYEEMSKEMSDAE